jgi:hypothetical protein
MEPIGSSTWVVEANQPAKPRSCSNVVKARPEVHGYLRLGLLLEVAGQRREARSAFESALEMDPGFTPARQALQNLDSTP